MFTYFIRKLLYLIPTILVVSFSIFVFLNVMPGDAALLSGNPRGGTDSRVIEGLRAEWGLDQPLYIRYGKYLWNLIHGNLGISFRLGMPVNKVINERLGPTFRLAIASMLFAILGGVSLGCISAFHQGSWLDLSAMIAAVAGMSVPNFWLGLMLIYFVGVKLQLLPTSGYGHGDLRYILLPMITLGARYMALLARITRASVLEVLDLDYVITARSKGITEVHIQIKHILRNALIPVVTIIGMQFGSMLASTVVVETVFTWSGVGSLLVESIFRRDVPILQGCILLIAAVFLILNLFVDLLYTQIDPRITYS